MKRVTDYFAAVPAKRPRAPVGKKIESQSTNVQTLKGTTPDSTGNAKGTPATPVMSTPVVSASAISASAISAPAISTPAISTPVTNTTQTKQHKQFNKSQWIAALNDEARSLLATEIATMHDSWLAVLHPELTKPYFLSLKRFLLAKRQKGQVFPPDDDIYSWSRLTPLPNVSVLVLGQDPYHNVGQAHGLAFSVRPPTKTPPSLVNIYKELKNCYPDFEVPSHGLLNGWAAQGVLLLNACLTVDAHQANSHAKKGWETFTGEVIKAALKYNDHVAIMAWGNPAAKRVELSRPGPQHLVLRSVHPSPLSASRGWFGSAHFPKANEWLEEKGRPKVDWTKLTLE